MYLFIHDLVVRHVTDNGQVNKRRIPEMAEILGYRLVSHQTPALMQFSRVPSQPVFSRVSVVIDT